MIDGGNKMKKVAIVSCYFQNNYGSMIQAFATQKILDKLGYENETINISRIKREINRSKRNYFIKASLTSKILIYKIGMVRNVLLKKYSKGNYGRHSRLRTQKFISFQKKAFRLSEEYKSKNELSEKCKEKYSAVVVGSDQLWLPGNIAGDYYTLTFVPQDINTIAYATSFGQDSLPKDSAKKAKSFLKNIRHIGVREESGQKLIESLTMRKVPIVCDPTILLTGEEWLVFQKQEPIISGSYILCYFLGKNPLHRTFAERLRKFTGYKIIALIHLDEYVKYDNKYADETPYDIDPMDFLNLIRNASYICTDSYHCSVFSILYKKEFFTFERYSTVNKHSTNSRLYTLFETTGISNRIKVGNEDINECLSQVIDYELVHNRLEQMRKHSLHYLQESLADKGGTDLDRNN